MDFHSDDSSESQAKRVANYRVRFRHGVFPSTEAQATRSDIKKYDYFFGSGQKWVDVQGNVDFVDESAQIAAEAKPAEQAKFVHCHKPSNRFACTKTVEKVEKNDLYDNRQATFRSIRPATRSASVYVPASTSSPNYRIPYHRHASPATSSVSTSSLEGRSSLDWSVDTSQSAPAPYATQGLRTPCTLSDPLEAQLYRYWVDTVGPGWDMASPQKIFTDIVPQMALNNRMLLDAILLIASQHILRFDPLFPAKPFLYHERVLQQLIPFLSGTGSITDESTLLTAIFLRGFEELHAGTKGQHYLSTFELFQGTNGWHFDLDSPVVQACFLVHVRYEIYSALLNQPSLQVDYRTSPPPILATQTDDASWSNRIVWIAARILQWLLLEDRTLEGWHAMKSEVDQWEQARPQSFDAFFYRESTIGPQKKYPELWFRNACHVDAHQHLGICRIALATSYTAIEPMEYNRNIIEKSKEAEISDWLKRIIAVARCNPQPASAPKLAAHVIHRFARQLRYQSDRLSILEFLNEVDDSGWSTVATQSWLKAEWALRPSYSS